MRSTHRRNWKKEDWLVVDERTGTTHYASEMVQEKDSGLWVHRADADPPHPLLRLRPRYRDPAPITGPIIPVPVSALGDGDRMLPSYIGGTTIQRRPSPADHIFHTGVGEMIVEGWAVNEFTDFEVDTTARAMFPST